MARSKSNTRSQNGPIFTGREHPDIYNLRQGRGKLASLFKIDTSRSSLQAISIGDKSPPFDIQGIYDFQVANIHHSRCIRAKRASTVGLGFSNPRVAETLNPLCDDNWQNVIDAVCDDYWMTGTGYLEVVRDGGAIVGLHHIKARDVRLYVEDRLYNRHYYVEGAEGTFGSVIFARFGEADDLASPERVSNIGISGRALPADGRVAEIIPFKQTTALDRWFGFPDWLAAVTSIELVQANHQHFYEFYVNRGVPEFMLWVLGQTIEPGKWAQIERSLKRHVGLGNSHQGFACNLDGDVRVQVERMAMEGSMDAVGFDTANGCLALEIVSAHGVPPLLAGIQIPGKLGASNELPNALMAFQALVIGQAQHSFEQVLASTLGDPSRNGGLGLAASDFLGRVTEDTATGRSKKVGGLRTILDEIDIGVANTVGRMRETLPEAQAAGRDLSAGVKD